MKKTYTYLLVMLFGITLSAQSNLQFTSSCDDIQINACGGEQVNLIATATTDCASSTFLIYNYQVDENNDGSIDLTGSSNEVNQLFPLGVHRVLFTVTDNCNNSITCEYLFTLVDTELPIPVCLNGLATIVMPSTGSSFLWAADFESGSSFDNCTDYQDLVISFSSDPNDVSMEIDCNDLFLNNCGAFPIEIWITDEAGNQDYCLTYILIQDLNNVCGCMPPQANGVIAETPGGDDLCNFEVCVNTNNCLNANGNNSPLPIGTQNGDVITLNKNDHPVNGATTFDLVLISKHILGNLLLDTPEKMIAADVNLSNTITTLDIVLIRALILQINTQFPNGESWVFSPEEHIFNQNISQYEFTAIKLGDVNGSANPSSGCLVGGTVTETRNLDDPLELFTLNQFLEKGKTYTIPIFAENYFNLLGGQFTLNFAKEKIDIREIKTEVLPSLSEENFNLKSDAGILLCSWANGFAENLNSNQPLFELEIIAKENTSLQEVLDINSATLKAEAYKEVVEGYEFLDLQFNVLEKPTEGVQVIPNPFTNFTNISFTNMELGQVEFHVFDLSGKRIFSQNKNMNKGFQNFRLEKDNLPASGIYFYEIKTKNKVYSGKIIH